MTNSLRLFLVISAVAVLLFVIKKIKKSQMQAMDALFWLFFSLSFVVLAMFPQLATMVADLLGFQASSNCVFLYVIAVLIARDFSMTVKFAKLRDRFDELIQEVALKQR